MIYRKHFLHYVVAIFYDVMFTSVQDVQHIVFISVHCYSVSVLLVAPLLTTDEFFTDRWCSNVFVDVVATYCCLHH